MYESRHQSHHAWATFCSTVFETVPLVTCKSKSNRKSRLTNSTLVSYQGHINSCWIQPSPHHRPSSDVYMELYGVRSTVQKSGRYPQLCFSSLHLFILHQILPWSSLKLKLCQQHSSVYPYFLFKKPEFSPVSFLPTTPSCSAVTHAWSPPERTWVFLFCPTYLWRWAEEVAGDDRGLYAVNWLRLKREPQSSHEIVSKSPGWTMPQPELRGEWCRSSNMASSTCSMGYGDEKHGAGCA